MIFRWVIELLKWFRGIWNRLDDNTKREIIEAVMTAFEDLLRAFYRWWSVRRKGGNVR